MSFKKIITLFFVVALFACKKDPISPIANLNGDFIHVVGHGGTGFQSAVNFFPENSMGGIKRAIEVYNADGVEVDIQLTKDGQLVLYHDDQLETSTYGNGFIYDYTFVELGEFKYNADAYANVFLDERIASLEALLQFLSQRRIKPQLHLDLRASLYDSQRYSYEEFSNVYISTIVQLIQKYNYEEFTYLASSQVDILLKMPPSNIKLMVETGNVYQVIDIIKQNAWYGVVVQNSRISKEDIDYAHANNLRVALFNVKTQKSIVDAVNKHPDFIITDNIIQLQQVLYH